MTELLRVENMSVNYGAIRAVKNLNFTVQQGEIVTFVGSNGAGKTTTLRTLSGLIPSASGKITFAGVDITKCPSHQIVRLGLSQSPEGRMVFPDMTVQENLIMGAFSRKESHAVLKHEQEHVFSLFPRLKERATQMANTLSGGEQQMLAIGRALMAQPKLLLLDEPSMGLAPMIVETIFRIIGEIRDAGTTVLVVEQNAAQALRLADRGYVMENGSIAFTDTAQKLLHDPRVRAVYLGESIE